jgi:hypothetical protein
MRLAIWAKSPSPHQTDFYAALRRAGVDLQVRYLGNLRQSRRNLGWSQAGSLVEGEEILTNVAHPLTSLADLPIDKLPSPCRRRTFLGYIGANDRGHRGDHRLRGRSNAGTHDW